jgi:PmbA protein
MDLDQLAAKIVRMAVDQGASDAECTIAEGDEFSANVRMREIESLKEAGSRSAGLRVLRGLRSGSSYTSDVSAEGVRRLVESALELASLTSEDPHAGLPDPSELGSIDGDLGLYFDDVARLETSVKIEQARAAEEAAFAVDPRISNSEGASFDSYLSRRVFANSRGFLGSYRSGYCLLSVVPVAREGDAMERDYWASIARTLERLEPPSEIGRIAAQRALRRLGARKIPTCKAKVVFEPRTARSLIGHLFEAVSGDSIYRNASFLAGKLGEKIASDQLTLIDDGTISGLFGSSPFDDEGVPSRRTAVIEQGVLKSYLLNTYTARKLGLKTTGNASRGVTGAPGIGHGNLYIEAGSAPPDQLLKSVGTGFYVTELIGFGVNIVTGDYSRGAAGMWIENGEPAYPVSEVTIAGNLSQMLVNLEAIGSDLEFRGSTASPTLVISEMTISGR